MLKRHIQQPGSLETAQQSPLTLSDSSHVKVQRKQTGFKPKALLESSFPGGPKASNPR